MRQRHAHANLFRRAKRASKRRRPVLAASCAASRARLRARGLCGNLRALPHAGWPRSPQDKNSRSIRGRPPGAGGGDAEAFERRAAHRPRQDLAGQTIRWPHARRRHSRDRAAGRRASSSHRRRSRLSRPPPPRTHRFEVYIQGQKRRAAGIKRESRRRAAAAPAIGYIKAAHRMGRNYPAHPAGGAIDAAFAAVGHNFRRLLAWLGFCCPRSPSPSQPKIFPSQTFRP